MSILYFLTIKQYFNPDLEGKSWEYMSRKIMSDDGNRINSKRVVSFYKPCSGLLVTIGDIGGDANSVISHT